MFFSKHRLKIASFRIWKHCIVKKSEHRPPLSMMLCTMNVAKDQHSTADSVDLDWRFDICAGLGGGGGVAITSTETIIIISASFYVSEKRFCAEHEILWN